MSKMVFFFIVSIITTNAYAIPPLPPTQIKEKEEIICKDANALTEKEIEDLGSKADKIISFDEELREVCFKK
jgi:hypothetical protein